MPQSLSKIYLHIIFHTKTTSPTIADEDLERVHAYIAELINSTGCINIWTDGVGDHVHSLCILSRQESVAHLLEEVKRNSSRWIKSIDARYKLFEWQGGYAAFSVSQSVVDSTLQYIKHQKEHHVHHTFETEYVQFLKLYNVEYDEQYIFTD